MDARSDPNVPETTTPVYDVGVAHPSVVRDLVHRVDTDRRVDDGGLFAAFRGRGDVELGIVVLHRVEFSAGICHHSTQGSIELRIGDFFRE